MDARKGGLPTPTGARAGGNPAPAGARWAFLSGEYVPEDAPAVRLTDRALTFADGLFEILLVRRGVPLFFDEHVARMADSADELGMHLPYAPAELLAAAHHLIARNRIVTGEIYMSLSRGVDPHRDHRFPPEPPRPVFYMLVFPLRDIPAASWERGVDVYAYPDERHGLCRHKTLNLLANVRAKNHAYARGGYEAVMYREVEGRRYVTEGGSSSYFCVRGGQLWTPAPENILAGITWRKVLELANSMGIPVKQGRLWWDDFRDADEALLCSTVSRVMPIRRVEDAVLAAPGPITVRLMEAYEDLVARDLEARPAE